MCQLTIWKDLWVGPPARIFSKQKLSFTGCFPAQSEFTAPNSSCHSNLSVPVSTYPHHRAHYMRWVMPLWWTVQVWTHLEQESNQWKTSLWENKLNRPLQMVKWQIFVASRKVSLVTSQWEHSHDTASLYSLSTLWRLQALGRAICSGALSVASAHRRSASKPQARAFGIIFIGPLVGAVEPASLPLQLLCICSEWVMAMDFQCFKKPPLISWR